MKKLLLTTMSSLTILFAQAQCEAEFSYMQNGPTTIFTDLSTVSPSFSTNYSVTWAWDFGDGNTSTQQNPVHTYSTNGTFVPELTVTYFDSTIIDWCMHNSVDTVIIGNAPPTPCSADFYSWNNGNNNDVALYAADSTQIGTYTWEMGDGTVMTTTTGEAFYTYGSSGLYFACLTFDDGMGCTETYCDSVYVGNSAPLTCNSDFYWWQDYDSTSNTFSNVVYLVNMASGGVAPFTYAWDFGDGNTSNQQYPVHTYSQVGNYAICLSITDANGCTDTYCDQISVVLKASGFTLNVISESQAASVGIEDEEVISLTSLYPNPVNESATLEFNATQNTNLNFTVIDISGKQVNNFLMNVNSGNNKIAIETSDLANGYYMLNLSSTDGNFTKTIRFTK